MGSGSTHSPFHEVLKLLPSAVMGPPGKHCPLPVTPEYFPVPPFMTQLQSLKSGVVALNAATQISPWMSVTEQIPLKTIGAPSADSNMVELQLATLSEGKFAADGSSIQNP